MHIQEAVIPTQPSPVPDQKTGTDSRVHEKETKAGNLFVQAKLTVGAPDDPYEREADAIAKKVMRMPDQSFVQRKCAHCEEEEKQVNRKPLSENITPFIQTKSDVGATVNNSVSNKIFSSKGSGSRLDNATQSFMSSRFGADFNHVKIHTNDDAIQMNRELNAKAFTTGNDIYFNEGQYQLNSGDGKHLLAHELTHTIQQAGKIQPTQEHIQRYTDAERREMAERRVTGRAADTTLASQRHFETGDIVFRRGSTGLAFVSGQPVTHGGIYIGGGLIHDAVGFGNRNVRVSDFYDPALGEAADRATYRVVRFRGPLRDLIIDRLISNINAGNFRMPTDPVPFNLFSTADDYRTATCLEYAHAQFLHAIHSLVLDPAVPAATKEQLRTAYYRNGASMPSNLIQPTEQRLVGNMPDMGSGMSTPGTPPPRTPSALIQAGLLVAAATALATDVDPTRFSNRDESVYTEHWPGGSGIGGTILNLLMGPTYDEVVLRTFTYQSFVDSRQFFADVTSP